MSFENRKKAAALVLALGTDKAGALLQHLSEAEIKSLADQIAEIEEIKAEERDGVYRETLTSALQGGSLSGGMDRARELLANYHGNAGNVLIEDGKPGPFGFLRRLDGEAIASLVEDDHPQTIALVASDVGTELASAVIRTLPESLRAEVALRLATIGPVKPELIDMIATDLASRLGGSDKVDGDPLDGAKALAEILNSGSKDEEEEILGFIGGQDSDLAERVRALMFVFEDIVDIDDRGIQGILKNLDTATLALALKGTSEQVQDAITRNLSERAKAALLEEIDLMGPVRRSEVEEAQAQCVAQIRLLEESGELVLARGGNDELVS